MLLPINERHSVASGLGLSAHTNEDGLLGLQAASAHQALLGSEGGRHHRLRLLGPRRVLATLDDGGDNGLVQVFDGLSSSRVRHDARASVGRG